MRFYLCSGTSRAEDLESFRLALESRGHQVTSRWHSGSIGTPRLELDDPTMMDRAQDDLSDVAAADVLISFESKKGRGGRHFEAGYAYGIGRQVWLVGEREHAFHTMVHARFIDWANCLTYVEQELS